MKALLNAYFDGQLSPAEEQQLAEQLAAKPQRTAEEEALLTLLAPPLRFDEAWVDEATCAEYDRLLAARIQPMRVPLWARRIAAAAVVGAVAVGMWMVQCPPSVSPPLAQTTSPAQNPAASLQPEERLLPNNPSPRSAPSSLHDETMAQHSADSLHSDALAVPALPIREQPDTMALPTFSSSTLDQAYHEHQLQATRTALCLDLRYLRHCMEQDSINIAHIIPL